MSDRHIDSNHHRCFNTPFDQIFRHHFQRSEMPNRLLLVVGLLCAWQIGPVVSRNHDINITSDNRAAILLSHFGYNPNGYLFLDIGRLEFPADGIDLYGLSLDLTSTSSISSLVDGSGGGNKCMLREKEIESSSLSAVLMRFNTLKNSVTISYHGSRLQGILVYGNVNRSIIDNSSISSMNFNFTLQKKERDHFRDNLVKLFTNFISKENATEVAETIAEQFNRTQVFTTIESDAVMRVFNMSRFDKSITNDLNVKSDLKIILITVRRLLGSSKFPLTMERLLQKLLKPINFYYGKLPLKLLIKFPTAKEEGDFDLYFHNCHQMPHKNRQRVNFSMQLIEKNWNSYLSAGDQPLPLLFFIMCSVYLILAIVWAINLGTSKHMVFKIHYLMLVLLIMKALTLFFHAINYYEIGRYGVQEKGWAIMYYITHLLKGALLFTTIILIGAGWAFIKHMLTSKEKKIFVIIIPLQILANIAAIIIDESEESAVRYLTWRNIFLLVDLICCGAILFPVIWSIKHLKEASNIDGKQVQNLVKLRLFRHFYILIICYIYFTRIIVYLLIITVSFKLSWTVDLFRELSTVVFMIITGYKFRPVSNNPYLQVPDEDSDDATEQEQMEHAWAQSGITDGVVKIHREFESDSDDNEPVLYEKPAVAASLDNHVQAAPAISGNSHNGLIHTSKL